MVVEVEIWDVMVGVDVVVLSFVWVLFWFIMGFSKFLFLCFMNMFIIMGRDMKLLVVFGLGDRYNFWGLGVCSRIFLW